MEAAVEAAVEVTVEGLVEGVIVLRQPQTFDQPVREESLASS